MKAVATDPVFYFKYTRFTDWRFIDRTRTNLVPLNANNHSPVHLRCQYPKEIDSHVLGQCMRNAAAYQRRHDAIVKRIIAAAMIIGTQFKHDVIIIRSQEAHIIDVIIPFEGTEPFEDRIEVLDVTAQEKRRKYGPLALHLRNQHDNI